MKQTLYPEKPILMVDDEESWLVSLEMLLARHGKINNTILCANSSKVMGILAEQECSLVLLDYSMPEVSGEELLTQMAVLYPELPVVVLTGYNQVDTAVHCKDLGAVNYLVKTKGETPLAKSILEILQKHTEPATETIQLLHPERFTDIIAESPKMRSACIRFDAEIDNRTPLLLVGEQGVGKKFLFDKLIAPADNVYVLDAETDRKAILTDKKKTTKSIIENNCRHVYLKNIHVLEKESQLLLLKLLQRKLDIRFVLTLPNLKPETTEFLRKDLLHLLKVHMIEIPLLRDRKKDLSGLTRALIKQAATEYGKKTPTPPAELDLLLRSYAFPGNISELKSMIFRAVESHQSKKLSMDSFKQAMLPVKKNLSPHLQFSETLPTIEEATELLIAEAEKRADGNQSIMAAMLGISRQALNNRLKRRKN